MSHATGSYSMTHCKSNAKVAADWLSYGRLLMFNDLGNGKRSDYQPKCQIEAKG